MYSNIAKAQAIPFATVRVYSKPSCSKQYHALTFQSLTTGSGSKPLLNPVCARFTIPSRGFNERSAKGFSFAGPVKLLVGFEVESVERGYIAESMSFLSGFRFSSAACCCILRARNFSSSSLGRVGRGKPVVRAGKPLPWLSSNKVKESKGLEKEQGAEGRFSSQVESVKRLENINSGSSWEQTGKKLEKGTVRRTGSSSWEKSAKALEKGKVNVAGSSWEGLAERGKNGKYRVGNKESETRMVAEAKDREICYDYNAQEDTIQEPEVEEGELEDDDPRWDKIKHRVEGMVDLKDRKRRPESQRWNKQESWGRKIWKEATESSVPKIVGEGVYGIGPVLAALSAGRREFYSLYVQEGLDLSSNNRKKKDKKGFEKALKIAQKTGLSIKEVSKHDLNMVVDSRPHQGLVLDASPLEMVKIGELDAILPEEEKGSLWVALDEVTDPQNLGAIIRSAYFFGASGIVLCAKNSAPLSAVASKASAGSLEAMELRYCKNMMQFLVSSAENGWRVLGGSVSSKAVPLNEVLPGEPTILVLGSEGTGLRPLVERSCSHLVRIPGNIPFDIIVGEADDFEAQEKSSARLSEDFRSFLAVESLNVSVAAGVLLHHLIGNNHKGHTGYMSTDVPI
uniref:rRNA methyltransferase 1, mitochondrial n=1 Tax=Rhizophora mucronata TaxID=61149 RepID=A0A2P2IJQ6_RHIMU